MGIFGLRLFVSYASESHRFAYLISNKNFRFRTDTGWLVCLTIAIVLSCSPAFAWHGLVVKVLDGDSIRVKRNGKIHEIRLYGIDAPEYGQGYGNKAKSYTRALTYKKTVTIEPMDTDRYGRIVALVKSQGRLVNRELVRDGFAWVYPKYCNRPSLCNEMKKLE
ncbi:MAG: hypothetical protein GQ559_11510, partial [Desulfobulbaceae bacterium]|nr:hypothetical protein [Desulfobulbaceae bacterium]